MVVSDGAMAEIRQVASHLPLRAAVGAPSCAPQGFWQLCSPIHSPIALRDEHEAREMA